MKGAIPDEIVAELVKAPNNSIDTDDGIAQRRSAPIAGLKPYADYADSRLPWLGPVPSHWDLLRAKYLFREVNERSIDGKEELLSVSHLTGVTPRSQKTVTMFLAKSNIGYKICRPGDVAINTMWAWMGALGVARDAGIVSPAYGVYRPLSGCSILPKYADYLLRTPLYAAEYLRRSTGCKQFKAAPLSRRIPKS